MALALRPPGRRNHKEGGIALHLKQLVLAGICSAVLAGPIGASSAMAQATTQTPPKPMTTMPATKPAAPAPAPAAPAAQPPKTGLVNINTATPAELDKLPQIGEKRAAKIIQNRPYKSIDELVSKKAISKGVFEKIKDKITV
jgi:competence ComEA-like helix-hairpin-helix protein